MIVGLTLAALLASFLAPPLYAGAMLAILVVLLSLRGVRISPPLVPGTGIIIAMFLTFAGFAILGPILNYGVGGRNIDALKFIFATASLAIGFILGVEQGRLSRLVPVLIAMLALVYGFLYVTEGELSQESLLYPPDNNHSASMLGVLLPVIVLRTKGALRIACLVMLAAFAFFAASRALLALTLLAAALSSKTVREQRAMMVATVALAGAILFYQGFSMDNFSDRLRLQILEVSLHFAQTRGAYAFNFGEAAFSDYLNIYPIYQRLEIQHAHNILLQVWVAYGIVPFAFFAIFLVTFFGFGLRQRNTMFLAAFTIFMALGMMEAIITDIRALGTIMLALGYTYSRGSVLGRGDLDLDDGPATRPVPGPTARSAPPPVHVGVTR